MVSTSFFAAAIAAVALGAAHVDGHGFLVKPKPHFQSGVDITSYTGTIMGDAIYPGFAFNTAPSINMENFVKNFKNDTRHPNLKTLVEKNQKVVMAGASAKCGYTDPSKTNEPLVGNTIIYGRNFEGTGEGLVHPGPCETWCDNKMVQQEMYCDEKYNVPGKAAIIPIDAAKCKGAKQLTIYWIAMHGNEWQVYLDCVGLSGATSGGSATTPTTAKPAGGSPAPTTRKPVAGSGSVTPKATTKAPKAPAKPTKKPSTKAPAKTPRPARPSKPEVGGEADDEDCEDELDVAGDAPATKAPKGAKAPKPAKTKKSKARSGEDGFDELEN
ncbi:hypothetical protein PybrP1_004845 [[Pythium] brassicae (nom. inval.)]|nr:hypothetical protein PybrP1_004845 [[Pythium] brassicae (nom. inval.)]